LSDFLKAAGKFPGAVVCRLTVRGIVGRRDDRSDPKTKLLDGARLLEVKEKAIARWCQETGAQPVNPVMLVIAPNIAPR